MFWIITNTLVGFFLLSTQPLRQTGVNLSSPYYRQQLQHHNTSWLPPQAYDTPLIPPAIMAILMKP